MPRVCSLRNRWIGWLGFVAVTAGPGARPAGAQETGSSLGLPAAGALGVFGSGAWLERHSGGGELGALLDLGWIRARRLRIQGEVSLLRGSLTETVLVEDRTYEGSYFDLTTAATAVLHGGDAAARLVPYVLAGVGVHATSSAFGTFVLDQRYNTNRFGSQIGLGVRAWAGASGRRGAFIEVRRVIADHVNRTVVRAGGLWFMGDMVRAAPPR